MLFEFGRYRNKTTFTLESVTVSRQETGKIELCFETGVSLPEKNGPGKLSDRSSRQNRPRSRRNTLSH